LDFPEDRSDEVVKTLDLFSLLNYYLDSDRPTNCFSIIFPLELAYNNGIIISVEDLSGMNEAIENQSKSFYIEGVVLPILVNKNGVLSSIEDKEALKLLVNGCEIPRLTDFLDDFEYQCFELAFPFTLINNTDTLIIENEEMYHDIKASLGADFLPEFQFPMTVEVYETDETIEISSYYELFQIINSCKPCPEGDIIINPEYDGSYTFKAVYHRDDTPINYKWYINEDFIGEGHTNTDDSLVLELPEGEFEICLKSFGTDCNAGTFSCRTITVERPCPVLFFEQEKSSENPLVYYFYADFTFQNEISYEWVVYKNDDPIYLEEELPGITDSKLTYEFTAGSYRICIEKENVNQNCQLAQYCTEIFIE